MKRLHDWWYMKCRTALLALAGMIAAIGVCTVLSVLYSGTFILGLALPYWLYIVVLPAAMIFLLFRHNRVDQANDRFNDHSGIN